MAALHSNTAVASAGPVLRDESSEPENDAVATPWAHVPIAIVLSIILVVWLALILQIDQIRFVIVAPAAKAGFEVFLALLRLFAALVLFLFPVASEHSRLRWVALGFLILGLGGLGFGYLYSATSTAVDLNITMYGSLLTRSIAAFVMAIGLVVPRPLPFTFRAALVPLVICALLAWGVISAGDRLPSLVAVGDLEAIASTSSGVLTGLTPWHWGLSLLPLLFAGAAVFGGAWHYPGRVLGGWLVVAMVLMAGSQLHTLFWPSAYSPVVTTSSLLRLAFTIVVAVGGFLELRHVATERARLLANERETVRMQKELAALRASFTAMVGHELGNPLAAIRRGADLVAMAPLNPIQARGLATIEIEVEALRSLIKDVQAASAVEGDHFTIQSRPTLVATLLADAAVFAQVLAGDHPVTIEDASPAVVLADPERIGQVLRNLLTNAAKYTPPGTPITLRALRQGDRVRIEVADQGPGIDQEDLPHIFEKFGRGREANSQHLPGVGLGLYVSRGIVEAHGGELTVISTPGEGTVFAFDLPVA